MLSLVVKPCSVDLSKWEVKQPINLFAPMVQIQLLPPESAQVLALSAQEFAGGPSDDRPKRCETYCI